MAIRKGAGDADKQFPRAVSVRRSNLQCDQGEVLPDEHEHYQFIVLADKLDLNNLQL